MRVSLGGQGFPMYQVEGGLRLGTLLGWGSDILSPLACCYPSLPGPLGPPSSQILLLLAAEPSEFRPTSDAGANRERPSWGFEEKRWKGYCGSGDRQ